MGSQTQLTGPDLKRGVAEADVRDAVPVLGHADGEPVVVVRDAGALYAVSATCTHYGGPLAEGLVAAGTIRCPWHHACFDLRTGRAEGPALAPVACWDVAVSGGIIRVGAKRQPSAAPVNSHPASVVIIGSGPAGVACAERLRADGHRGTIAMISAEGSDPVDRPNLSKDYLAGTAPEEWIYLRTADALAGIDVSLIRATATAIDRANRTVRLSDGQNITWDALVIATGAEPIRLPIEGADLAHVHTLRTLTNSKAIAAAAAPGSRAVVIGASFIGLEVAASLRARNVEVTVVGPEAIPLARVLGDEVGAFVRSVHEANGVAFELGRKPTRIAASHVELDDGRQLAANLVVMGVGVKPRLELATAAGLAIDRGIVVDSEFRAAPGVWAGGDAARYSWNGELVRIEHWQVAVRHGQAIARSILRGSGETEPRAPAGSEPSNLRSSGRRHVPFFWSQHHDVTLGYVGHAEKFDRADVVGDLQARDAHVVYRDGGRVRAIATLGRDRLALEVEEAMEREDDAAVDALVGARR